MKRFHWPLQRLLDVTRHRESTLRHQVLQLVQEEAALRGELLRRRTAMRVLMEEISARPMPRRLNEQEVIMTFAPAESHRIRRLERRQGELRARRRARTARLKETRGRRKTLERLREEAWGRHMRLQLLREQKQFDETAQVAHVRRNRAAAATGAGEADHGEET